MTKNISVKITGTNVLMTLLIVMMHCTWESPEFSFWLTITDIAVPTFFAISSYLYFQKWELSWSCYTKKLFSRAKSLLVPLAVFNMICWLWYMVTVSLHLWPTKSLPPTDIWGIIQYIWFSDGDSPLWYLRALFIFALFAPLIGSIIKYSKYSFLLIPIVVLYTNSVSYNSFVFWLPNILFGAYIALYEKECEQMYAKVDRLFRGGNIANQYINIAVCRLCICWYSRQKS